MDTNDYYALIGPCIVLAMLVEAWIGKRRGLLVHHLPDSLSNLATGMGQVLVGVFTGAFLLALYDGFQATFAIVTWPKQSPLPWVFAFFGVDFCYYWWHRASHSIAAFWALHVVHHQSNEMNLSVSLRQTYFSDFTALLFYWPLPFLGIPREAFFFAVGGLSLYQAFLHNQLFDRTGIWGKVFNCPAFHRLHHACDEGYRDKNFGSTLIIWDRIFGTFVAQSSPPTYGTLHPHVGHDPVLAQVEPIVALARRVRAAPSFRAALAVLFREPGWSAPWEESHAVVIEPRPPRLAISTSLAAYAIAQSLVIAICAEFVLLLVWRGVRPLDVALGVCVLIAGPVSIGALLERKSWSMIAEPIRLFVMTAVLGILFARHHGTASVMMLVTWSMASVFALVFVHPRRSKSNASAEMTS